ncbi:hypothetical protein [Sphingobacterium corticibacterium]|uniref:hypothetical protein n=1 Tax=Sphingobacterium corticibacterium TaxID=2484746 RepID=UPI0013EE83E2|nr:hypothetical protein [Sphingobacterium corticibacterium]
MIRIIWIVFLLMLIGNTVFSQQIAEGTVEDEEGKAIPNVNIVNGRIKTEV